MDIGSLKQLSRKIKILSDPTRIKLLVMLSARPLCVCELTYALGLAQPTVSRHMQKLEDAGFVSGKRQGTWIIYQLYPADTTSVKLLDATLPHAAEDPECKKLIKSLKRIDRKSLCGNGKVKQKDRQ